MRRKSKKLTAILVFATAFFVVMELSSTQNLYILRASVSEKSAPIVHLDRTENVISGLCSQIGKFFTGLSGSLSYATAVSANYVVPDESVCASEIEKTASAKTTAAPQKEVATPETAPKAEETQTVEKNINSSSGNIALSKGITIKNQTKYSVNTKQIIGRGIPFSFSGSPQVLILHTHGTESYTPSQQYNFKYTSNSRTTDDNYNVVRVGTELTNYLKSMGISVVHDTTLYDYPDYNSSYDNAFGGIKAMLKKYPSISVVIDLHRDAINSNSGEKIKLTGDVNGEKAAQIMLVVGTDECGFSHPHWRDNLKFATMLQSNLIECSPSLARPIDLRTSRFNQQFTRGSLIVEVGTNGNTLDEALVSAKYLANALNATIKEIKKG